LPVVHGRSRGQEEVARPTGDTPVQDTSDLQRRTCFVAWCGVAFLFALLTAGCDRTRPSSEPVRDSLTIGVPEAVAGADLGLRNLAQNLSVEGLTQLSADGRALPKLAESWSWENSGLSLRVLLRRNVVFHDGTPLTATLAATVLKQLVARPSNRALFTSLMDVTDVTAEGTLAVVFHLSRPSSFLPEDLELPLEASTPAVGTGPYRVVNRSPSQIELQRFDAYYLGAPNIRQVIFKSQGALRTAWSALLRGDVDMITDVPPDAVQFVRNDDVQVVSFGRRYQYVIAFNTRKAPFNLPIVRRALNTAIDREVIVKNVLQGRGVPSTGPIWPQHWAYDRTVPSFGADPAAATALLEAAGFRLENSPDGPPARLRFVCLIPENFSVVERVALEIQKQLYNIGVDMQIKVVRREDFDTTVRSGKFDSIFFDMVGGPTLGRAYVFWGSSKSFSGLNIFGYENAEAERLFGVLKTTVNEAAIRSATSALQRVLVGDPPALFIAWNERSRAVRRDFHIVQDPIRDPADPIYTIWRWTPAAAAAARAQ
jgi:ABC-type transport system substrate-binding protein